MSFMSNQILIERVKIEIDEYYKRLTLMGASAKIGPHTPHDEIALTSIFVGCRLILDRAMNAIWVAHGTPRLNARKADIYFPCKSSMVDFDAVLQKSQLGKLQIINLDCFDAIRVRQPFSAAKNTWLKELFELTKEKHASYVEIISRRDNVVQIGKGQNGTIKSILFSQDGKIIADANMIDGITGMPAPLSLTFLDRFNHLLVITGGETVSYSKKCLSAVDETFTAIMSTLQ
jgi:hypothetical protein